MATSGKNETLGFPTLKWEEEELDTRPMPLHELPRQVGIENAMAIIAKHHARIAKAITLFWGTRECVAYIDKLVLSGGDGLGRARIGFKPEVVSALMSLISLHQVDK
ncbi:MAG: hypothetical protein ABJA49_11185 [Betaproteobacteria bacterium]